MMTYMRARTSSNFGQIGPRAAELRPLKDVRNWFLLNILRMDGQNLTKFCIHNIIDKIYIDIVKRLFFWLRYWPCKLGILSLIWGFSSL